MSTFLSDGCHLKPRCLGILARSFIPIINKDIFNPLISFPKLYESKQKLNQF